jgi:polyisoprenoid-binding protein YceI
VQGSITARGTAAPVDLTIIEIAEHDGGITVRATATVDRYAHGLTKGKGLAARDLHVQLIAHANRI